MKKRRQVTAVWPSGTIVRAGVIWSDQNTLHVRDGDKYLRLSLGDEGVAWIDGQHFEGSPEADTLMAVWRLWRSQPHPSG